MHEETLTFDGQELPVTVAEDGSRTVFYGGRFGYETWRLNATLDLAPEFQMEVLEAHWRAVMSLSEEEAAVSYKDFFTGVVGGLSFYELFQYGGMEFLINCDSDAQWAMLVGYRPLPSLS